MCSPIELIVCRLCLSAASSGGQSYHFLTTFGCILECPLFKDIVSVQQDDFSIAELSAQVRADDASNGAIVTFTGIVRQLSSGPGLEAMYLEHYPGMTEKALSAIIHQARERWPLGNVVVVHRIGRLELNDNIVFVGVGSAHRQAAFEAAQFIMDYLKRDAPFWKKEITIDGEHWVEAKQSDLDAADKWQEQVART